MGITGKPNLIVPGLRNKLTPLASSYAARTLTAKNDYLLHQAAACAFIGLSIPEYAARDIVQLRAYDTNWPTDGVFLDYGGLITDLSDAAKEIATESEWNEQLQKMDHSKLLTHDGEDHLPAEDIHLSVCIRRLILDYQHGWIGRRGAVHVLKEEAKIYLNTFHQEMRLFVQEARKHHSKKWVNNILVELYLTKIEASRPQDRRIDKARAVVWKIYERVTPFGQERMVKGKLRKPLRTALLAGIVFTAATGIAYAI